ncbi:hypothetical protein MPH_06305 [Macrophomina phaseolina MS6]|uniref:Uncharacterized protein n=1 Tax=Macrophomina phaseolina (strain MS6) TaxID=1126212 RepID=K2S223_MACPH|nr:hypothetical protein MPH_06305 [Macrophomina phaseolina MS6]
MRRLETLPSLKRRWNELFTRGGEGSRMLLEDVRTVHAQETVRQQRWKRYQQQQYAANMSYAGSQWRQPYHARPMASAEDVDRSFAIEDGNDEAPRGRPYYRARRSRTGRSSFPTSPSEIPQQHYPWWSGDLYGYPYFSSDPLAPSAAYAFPYYAAAQPYPPHQQPLGSPVQSTCKHNTSVSCMTKDPASAATTATEAATQRSMAAATAGSRKRTVVTATPDDEKNDERQSVTGNAQHDKLGSGRKMSSLRQGHRRESPSMRGRQNRAERFC